MELISASISFIVGYYALKCYRSSGARGLLLLYLGFVILGIGIFLRVVTATYFGIILRIYESSGPYVLSLLNVAAVIYTSTQLIAYSLFTLTYILQAKNLGAKSAELGAAPLIRLFFIPQLELVAITLLGFVTVYSFTNWLLKRGSGAALVFLGFGFMLLSHLFFLLMIVDEVFLFLGQSTQLVGFICLLVMLARVSRTNASGT
jgi:hypothetical protein